VLVVDDADAKAILFGVLDQFRSPVLELDFFPENRHSPSVMAGGLAVAGTEVTDNVVKHNQPAEATRGLY
jgi:hypothetical protein